MRPRALGVLEDIRAAINYLGEDTAGLTFEDFVGDRRTRQLVAYNVGKIGEAINRLRRDDPAPVERLANADQYITLRNARMDGPDAMTDSSMWQVVQIHLPALVRDVNAMLLHGPTVTEEDRIGERTMSQLIADNLAAIQALCREYGVRKLEVFGSAVTDWFDPERSDVDFIVEYPPDYDFGHWLARYFELKERLEALLDRSVDLVMVDAMKPRFIVVANETRQLLYAAESSRAAGGYSTVDPLHH